MSWILLWLSHSYTFLLDSLYPYEYVYERVSWCVREKIELVCLEKWQSNIFLSISALLQISPGVYLTMDVDIMLFNIVDTAYMLYIPI